jgi:predicted AAA+ superfamily ATPase
LTILRKYVKVFIVKEIQREAAATLLQLAEWYPAVVLTGPRQSGKTTLARSVFPHKAYVSLEDPDQWEFSQADPKGFLAQFPDGAILDEVQRTPTLLSWLQRILDEKRETGRFILTGSQQFGLLAGVSQSLAGRVGYLQLLPFSWREISAAGLSLPSWEAQLLQGFYPPIYDRGIPPHVWFGDYTASYLERDVRQLVNVRDLGAFQKLVKMCAARTGQMLNLSALAADCGVTHNTAKSWISILEASYVVMLLRPWHGNLGKRLVKSPKLYFLDTGLAAWLAGVRSPHELTLGSLRGALFETWVVSEFIKYRSSRGRSESIHFWRDHTGNEIDLVIERGPESLLGVECKSGATVVGEWLSSMGRAALLAGAKQKAIVYGGDSSQRREIADVYAWKELPSLLDDAFGVARGKDEK